MKSATLATIGAGRMLIKRICCRVPEATREAFRAAQACWAEARGLEGFLGQTGGFCKADSTQAWILGLWRDQPSYERFMANEHDRIFEASGQRQTYEVCDVAIYTSEMQMPGRVAGLVEALAEGAFLRIAEGKVRGGKLDDFLRAQREIWQPGMATAPGMIGGAFSLGRDDRERFLVTTLWDSEAAHADYVAKRLPDLRERAQVSAAVASMEGIQVISEPSWKVPG